MISPDSVATLQVFASMKFAQPLINSAPDFFSKFSTPLLSRPTIPSFHATRSDIFNSAGPGIEIPM